MSETAMDRGYGWGLQDDYATAITSAADVFKRIIATDDNTIDYEPQTANDESWAHGANQATEQWIEQHDAKVSHTIPGHIQELGKVFLLNLGTYAITTPPGGTVSRAHSFKPQNPAVSRQGKAVTYVETAGAGHNLIMPRAVGDGFTLKGDSAGVLTVDFGLQGAGKLGINASTVWTGGSQHVTKPTGLHKLFNTQVGLVITDGVTSVTYGCRYRSFEVAYQQTLLLAAGFKPGCQEFLIPGDPTSGMIRSACEFDKQLVDFNFTVDMAANSPELLAVQQQKKMNITITATGGIIEGIIPHKMTVLIPVSYYKTSKPAIVNDIWTFQISGSGFFDYATSKLLEIILQTNVSDFEGIF